MIPTTTRDRVMYLGICTGRLLDVEDEMAGESKVQISDVRTVGVPVTDQDRALKFYVDKLGFEKRLDVPMGGGGRWIEVAPPTAKTTIALVTSHEGVPAGVETGVRFTTLTATAWSSSSKPELCSEEA